MRENDLFARALEENKQPNGSRRIIIRATVEVLECLAIADQLVTVIQCLSASFGGSPITT
jgi:hypothetical protein